jgi:hypothetical protein
VKRRRLPEWWTLALVLLALALGPPLVALLLFPEGR